MSVSNRQYIVYATENCVFCKQAKALLEHYQASYEIKYEKAPEWDTYPGIYVNDGNSLELIGGFNELADYSYEHGL